MSEHGLRLPILHLDLDAFFAAVEILDRPELTHVPVIIGGRGPRSVVSSANYPARKYGVRSAMPVSRARTLCPQAVVIEPTMGKYRHFSKVVFNIFSEYSPTVEPLSVDEAFLDTSGSYRLFPDTHSLVESIRSRVKDETGLVVSVGGAAVKFVAKIASQMAKPDGALLIPEHETLQYLAPLPVGALWGVGRKTQDTLFGLGIRTIEDIRNTPPQILRQRLGSAAAEHIVELSHGRDARTVQAREAAKSMSQEYTFSVDEFGYRRLEVLLLEMSNAVAKRARSEDAHGKSIAIKVRFPDFKTVTRVTTLTDVTNNGREIFQTAKSLFDVLWREEAARKGVRLLGVKLSHFDDDSQDLQLWSEENPWQDLEPVLDEVSERFGKSAPKPASLLGQPDNTDRDRPDRFSGMI